MNPLLPLAYFTPDVEARVMPDGRLYLYGSNDISGDKAYCSKEYRVYSTDDPKLEKWTVHDVSFENTKKNPGIPWSPDTILYAPDAIEKNGKYYLYICGENEFEAVAESDFPTGPFGKARPVVGADGDGIDPSVFVDEDGQAYYFWGQFRLKGGKLQEDMATLDPKSICSEVLTEMEHGFHEGASIRKRNGKYYMVYTDISRGRATCMSYAVADAPLGPYKKGGVIIDNVYCDPQSWNNHGCIAEYKGQWYVFYHRASQNSKTSRRVCAEPIFFKEDGSICEVKMTSQGPGSALGAGEQIPAAAACRMKGNGYIVPTADAESCGEILTNMGGGNWIEDWAEYRYIDFGDGADYWKIRARGNGKITVKIEGLGEIGTVGVTAENWQEFSTKLLKNVSGIKTVWLLFDGQQMDVDWFTF